MGNDDVAYNEFILFQFAQLLGIETVFVIGGPDGLDDAVKKDARLLLRLRPLFGYS